MSKNSIDVIFTGLIREYDLFKKSIRDLVKLRNKNLVKEIILSTWKGEPSKHPDVLHFLKKNKITIIESNEPEVNKKSPYYKTDYIWHQMKALDIGLRSINGGRFVLKSRTDVYINPEFIKKLAKEKEVLLRITKDLPKGNVFTHKVWVPWFELTKPFFMADECFFGAKEDLQKLYNYNRDYFVKYDMGPDVHHVMRYINPFLESYPLLYSVLTKYNSDRTLKNIIKRSFSKLYEKLKAYSLLRRISEKNRFVTLSRRMKNSNYIDLLAAYYFILYSHFYIDLVSFKNQVELRDFYKGHLPKSDSKVAENNFSVKKVRFPGSGMLYYYDMGFINSLINGRLKQTPFSISLSEGIKNFENG